MFVRLLVSYSSVCIKLQYYKSNLLRFGVLLYKQIFKSRKWLFETTLIQRKSTLTRSNNCSPKQITLHNRQQHTLCIKRNIYLHPFQWHSTSLLSLKSDSISFEAKIEVHRPIRCFSIHLFKMNIC
jgi:hypothetical protein